VPANAPYDVKFWRGEIDRSVRMDEPSYTKAEENLRFYTGEPLDAMPDGEFVNTNVDFYETEQKTAQLFFESPELQFAAGAGFEQTHQGVAAFRKLVNVILGPDYIDALETVLISLKRCVVTTGLGPTVIGYHPTIQEVPPDQGMVPGAVLGLSAPVPVPVHEAWFWDDMSDKKFRKPADFKSTDFDKAPWLGMDFRLPLRVGQKLFNLPPDFEGTRTRDEKVLGADRQMTDDDAAMAYIDGTIVWYKAHLFDDDEIHPEIYRRHVIVDGLDDFADKDDPAWRSPYQTKLPNGRLRADSMIGNPIHVFSLRAGIDSANPPSDAKMRRPLVKELNLFRKQMVDERDINKPKFAFNTDVLPPDAITKIEAAMTGALIPLPGVAFAGGLDNNFRLLAQGTSPRQTYLANDYITTDIGKTSGIDATGAGVEDDNQETATKTAEVAKARNVRLDAERKRILRQYLKAVDGKIAPLVLRFCSDPMRVAELIGVQDAQLYLQWRAEVLEAGDPRPKFTAKPDSQIKLDAAAALKQWLNIYNFAAKDPLVNRGEILRRIFELSGQDAAKFIAPEPPESKPEPNLGFAFKGEDFNPLLPQFPISVEILAQCGIQISEQAILEAQSGAVNQVQKELLMGEMQPTPSSGKPAAKKPAQHGGLADKQGPLSKQDSEQTGNRPGPSVQ
jgi:hypothetical protein